MNNHRELGWKRVERNWTITSSTLRQQWGRLTNDDIDNVQGERRRLARCLETRYGIPREEAENQIDHWLLRQ